MSDVTVKITYHYRITARQVLEKIKAAMCGNGFEVALETAEFGSSTAPTRESVAADLLTLSEQMDKVARNMDELALVHGNEQPDHIEGGTWALLAHSIELHGAASAARSSSGASSPFPALILSSTGRRKAIRRPILQQGPRSRTE